MLSPSSNKCTTTWATLSQMFQDGTWRPAAGAQGARLLMTRQRYYPAKDLSTRDGLPDFRFRVVTRRQAVAGRLNAHANDALALGGTPSERASIGRSPRTPPWGASDHQSPLIPITGRLSLTLPVEPANCASPKLKIPPSVATSQ